MIIQWEKAKMKLYLHSEKIKKETFSWFINRESVYSDI